MKIAVIIGALALAFNGCSTNGSTLNTGKDENGNIREVEASGKISTKTENLAKFDKIKTGIVAEIVFVQDKTGVSKIEVKGNDNLLDIVKYEVRNGTLHIDKKKGYKVRGKVDLTVTVTGASLTELNNDGVGNVTIKSLDTPSFKLDSDGVGSCELGTIKAGYFEVESDGVGSTEIDKLTARNVKIDNSGVGSVSVSGTADNAVLVNSGVGSIEAGGLKCKTVDADCSGVGSIDCYASVKATYKRGRVGSVEIGGSGEKIKK